MKESIIIRNTGPLKNIIITDIPSLTVFIGPSGSGKSMLMKIVILMRYIFKLICIRSYLKNSGISKSPIQINFNKFLKDDLKIYLSGNPEAEIIYTFTSDGGDEYRIEYRNQKLVTAISIPDNDIHFSKESWVSETRNVIPSWIANPANSKGSLGFYFHETLSDFNEATRHIHGVDIDFINGHLDIEHGNGMPQYLFSMPGVHEPIELRYASSGIQTVAPLALLTKYFANDFSFKEAKKRSILSFLYEGDRITEFHPSTELSSVPTVVNIHVEEPELSLDPDSQIKMVDYLVATAFNNAENSVSLMLATHSPYIVNALNLIVNRNGGHGSLPPERVAAYALHNGYLIDLKSKTEFGNTVIDTIDLTDPMERILMEYNRLVLN